MRTVFVIIGATVVSIAVIRAAATIATLPSETASRLDAVSSSVRETTAARVASMASGLDGSLADRTNYPLVSAEETPPRVR